MSLASFETRVRLSLIRFLAAQARRIESRQFFNLGDNFLWCRPISGEHEAPAPIRGRGWVRVSVGNYRRARELMGQSGFTRGNWGEIYCILWGKIKRGEGDKMMIFTFIYWILLFRNVHPNHEIIELRTKNWITLHHPDKLLFEELHFDDFDSLFDNLFDTLSLLYCFQYLLCNLSTYYFLTSTKTL